MLDHHLPNDTIHHFNQQFSSKNGSYESWVPFNFASKPRKPAERYDLYSNDGIQLRQVDSGETESGVNSPPLWNNIPPESPASRLQAIVKGQKELMDMVKKMPESHYELTLKDIVEEQTKLGNSQEECLLKGKEDHEEEEEEGDDEKMDSRKSSAKSGRKDKDGSTSRRINSRSNSMDNNNNKGLFLKMVFPFGMKKKSKKKKNMLKSSSSGSAKISPKTEGCDRRTSSKYGDNKDWLKKMFSSGSDRSRTSSHSTRNGSTGSDKSSSSSSSSIRTRRGFCSSCLPCFHYSTKGKSAE